MEKGFEIVGLGGTYDYLHQGHKELLRNAFKIGKHVAIALTDKELQKTKINAEKIQSYEIRKQNLQMFIENTLNEKPENYTIIKLEDPFGPAITDRNLEAHVSSMENYPVAMKINEKRIENGLKPLVLVIIPLVKDESGKKLSSSTIRANL